MDLFFQTSGGSQFNIEVGYFDTVLEIKEQIQKHHGIPVAKQTLFFNGNVLPDDLNVHNSDILDQSRIHLVLASDAPIKSADGFSPPTKIRLLLKLPTPKYVTVEMDAKDRIQKLKEKIHEIEGIPVSRSIIHANGIELQDQKSIQDYEFLDNSEVIVRVRPLSNATTSRSSPANSLRVVLQYGSEKIPVEVNPSDNVGELRSKLQKLKMELPREGYFFIYKQNVMDDVRNFRWHHVGQGDTIEIFSGSVSGGS